jgi:hypothetical protein
MTAKPLSASAAPNTTCKCDTARVFNASGLT